MPKIAQSKINRRMCEKLELIIKDKDWINQDGSIHFPCCHSQCGNEAFYNKERLKELNIDVNDNKSIEYLSINHYQTCKRLKEHLEDPDSFYSKQWAKFENNKIDLTVCERTCYDCGKVFKDKKKRKRHTHEQGGCGLKIDGKRLGVYDFWETMPDDVNMIRGLGSNDERISLYVPHVSMNNMRKLGGNHKWCIAYDYDTIQGGKTLKTRYIVSKFDGRISGILNEQYKVYSTDFNDEQEDEEISNWVVSPAELRRLKCKTNQYMDGHWQFNTGVISQV